MPSGHSSQQYYFKELIHIETFVSNTSLITYCVSSIFQNILWPMIWFRYLIWSIYKNTNCKKEYRDKRIHNAKLLFQCSERQIDPRLKKYSRILKLIPQKAHKYFLITVSPKVSRKYVTQISLTVSTISLVAMMFCHRLSGSSRLIRVMILVMPHRLCFIKRNDPLVYRDRPIFVTKYL